MSRRRGIELRGTARGSDAVAPALLGLCGALAEGAVSGAHLPTTREEWERLTEAAIRHGVAGALPAWAREQQVASPDDLIESWEHRRLLWLAGGAVALQQFRDAAAALAREGVPVIPLKGAAILLWLDDARTARAIGDLDLLVPASDRQTARCVLEALGYTAEPCYRSPEAARLAESQWAPVTFTRPGSLRVDLQFTLLKTGNRGERVAGELWRESVAEEFEGILLRRLSWSHFLLHTAAHYAWHLRTEFAALKGLADCLLVLRRHHATIDGPGFWQTAKDWRVEAGVARVAATLDHCWGARIPGTPRAARPLPPALLCRGTVHVPFRAARARLSQLAAVRSLPGASARARYLRAVLLHRLCRSSTPNVSC